MQKLFVGGFDKETDEIELAKLFSFFGNINTIMIMRDHETKVSKGFGFVEMHNETEANEAMAQLHGTLFRGAKIKVSPAEAKVDRAPLADGKLPKYKKVERGNDLARAKRPRIKKY